MSEKVWLKIVKKNGEKAEIGSWEMPDKTISNFDDQQDLGWHVFLAIGRGDAVSIITKEEKSDE